jgi:hypothetical protein
MLRKIYQNLIFIVNGHIGFGDGTTADNIDGVWVNTTTPGIIANFTVTHNLGRVPVGYIVVKEDAPATLYDGTVVATKTQITWRATGGIAHIRVFVFALLLSLLAFRSVAQTTVNLNVTGTDAQVWMHGTWKVTIKQAQGTTGGPPFRIISGGGFLNDQAGALDGSGNATMSLPANANIAPAQSVWQFTVCPDASFPCFTREITIPISSPFALNMTPPPIVVNVLLVPLPITAYTDGEISGASKGTIYYNTTSSLYRQCNAAFAGVCSAWAGFGGTAVWSAITGFPAACTPGTYVINIQLGTCAPTTGSPGLPPGSVQYNNAGAFGGTVFLFNPTDATLGICSVTCASLTSTVDTGIGLFSTDAASTIDIVSNPDSIHGTTVTNIFTSAQTVDTEQLVGTNSQVYAGGNNTGGGCFTPSLGVTPTCANAYASVFGDNSVDTNNGQDAVGFRALPAMSKSAGKNMNSIAGFLVMTPESAAGGGFSPVLETSTNLWGLEVQDLQGLGTTQTVGVHIEPQTNASVNHYAIKVETNGGPSTFQGITATNIIDSALTASRCVQTGVGGLLGVAAGACGTGTGTVVSFSAGDFGASAAAVFTTAVSSPTVSPSLTFTAVSHGANQFYATPDGSSGTAGFRTLVSGDLPSAGKAGLYTNWASTTTVCSTTNVSGNTCTTTVPLNVTEANTAYKASCSGVGTITGYPFIIGIAKGTTSITVTITNGSASEAVVSTWSEVNCVVTR